MQVKFFLFQCGNKRLDQGDALPRLLRGVHEKPVMTMLLEFRGSLTKRATNAFTKLQLCPSPGRVKIRETLSAKVFHLCEEFLELLSATSELFNRGRFGPRARRFCYFCSCHRIWGKSSPAFTTWQENMGKQTGPPWVSYAE